MGGGGLTSKGRVINSSFWYISLFLGLFRGFQIKGLYGFLTSVVLAECVFVGCIFVDCVVVLL